MEKGKHIMLMEILNMRLIASMAKQKAIENYFMKMFNII